MVSTSNDIRKASEEAESRLNLHFLTCRKREDVYRVIKAFADRGEWLGYEAKRYTQCLVKKLWHILLFLLDFMDISCT
ncbi:hypothetical protein BHE74_00039748 [Ensete ventricosum]|nr:hypothetical protein GW17_00062364 [Ensete ventricosum]RWW53734.1 hypothetical protein BHE74_00039748 [Ensete ventricosum]RZR81523.1 hypothetical protein BHM03_00007768 [Ensete ventricosum]